MNIKKLAISAAAGAVMLSAVTPMAFASWGGEGGWGHSRGGLSVSNSGDIRNVSVNLANTGLNSVSGGENNHHSRHHGHSSSNGGSIRTGNAEAVQLTDNVINTSSDCGCVNNKRSKTTVENSGDISNLSVNVANTGLNSVDGKGEILTGDAFAGQEVTNVINTSVN